MKNPIRQLHNFLANIQSAKDKGVEFPDTAVRGEPNVPYTSSGKFCIAVVTYELGEKQPPQTIIFLKGDAERLLESLSRFHNPVYEMPEVIRKQIFVTEPQLIYFLEQHGARVVKQQEEPNDTISE
jgi:hypothetical protein